MYSLVIGVLAIFALAIYIGVDKLSDMTQGVYTTDTAEYQAAIQDRIRPLGQVYLPGEEAHADAPKVDRSGACRTGRDRAVRPAGLQRGVPDVSRQWYRRRTNAG